MDAQRMDCRKNPPTGKIAYFDCFSGAAGDMIVGALVDAGADAAALADALAKLGLDGYDLSIEKITKQGFAATRFRVTLDESSEQPHRHLSDVVDIIAKSDLAAGVKEQSTRVFARLAEAEAKVHGTSVERIHFHEVGAVDAILDIVGAVAALELLGVERVMVSPIPVGSGTVRCAHGTMPVPAPATVALLAGVPLAATPETGELTTPTGAALLTTLAASFGAVPSMRLDATGYGAGTREGGSRPNLLRVLLGTSVSSVGGDRVAVLETNIDDCSAEVIGYCMERLLGAGALDVYALPIQMKKSRPGLLLTVLCRPGESDGMERILFEETPTLGIRHREVDRVVMDRSTHEVATRFGPIRMKVGRWQGVETVGPEYEDCRKAAEAHSVPLREVLQAARLAWSAVR